MRQILIIIIFVLVGMIGPLCSHANEANIVKICVPSTNGKALWPIFKADGSGLYDLVYSKIYSPFGKKIKKIMYPDKRCRQMVKRKAVDIYPGGTKDSDSIIPKYAIWQTAGIVAFCKKKNFKKWLGVNSLKGRKLLSLQGTDHLQALDPKMFKKEIKESTEVKTPLQGIRMVVRDRAEVFVVSEEMFLAGKVKCKEKLNPDDYMLKHVGYLKFYPRFPKSERGQELANLFDKGIMRLYKSGELKRLFEASKWAKFSNIDPQLSK